MSVQFDGLVFRVYSQSAGGSLRTEVFATSDTAVGIGIAYATLKVKVDRIEKDNDQYTNKEYIQLAERITHQ
ncbi:MAG: hypothetical protein LBF75_00065 [Treponema sp.]|jgi:hypothetical protein|nr:hypothetical protein [Treponema sp.]